MRCASLFLAGLVFQPPLEAAEPVAAAGPVEYRSFRGDTLSLQAWPGSNIVFLTASPDLDRATMARLLEVFEGVRAFYRDATGRDPARGRLHDGRATIAEVARTCGAGCGNVGANGIELMPDCFRELYDGFRARGEIDQALPYEFGRNFWFYSPQLAPRGARHQHAFVTGYAVFMRFPALEAAGARVGRFRHHSGAEFRARVEELVDLYEADPRLSFTNTLAGGGAPRNPLGLNETDLFASFCLRLCRDHGGLDYARRLWREVARRPAATRDQDGIDNFVVAASAAAGRDLAPLFRDRWRWPVSPAAAAETAALPP